MCHVASVRNLTLCLGLKFHSRRSELLVCIFGKLFASLKSESIKTSLRFLSSQRLRTGAHFFIKVAGSLEPFIEHSFLHKPHTIPPSNPLKTPNFVHSFDTIAGNLWYFPTLYGCVVNGAMYLEYIYITSYFLPDEALYAPAHDDGLGIDKSTTYVSAVPAATV